jgi:hypothetical protein
LQTGVGVDGRVRAMDWLLYGWLEALSIMAIYRICSDNLDVPLTRDDPACGCNTIHAPFQLMRLGAGSVNTHL